MILRAAAIAGALAGGALLLAALSDASVQVLRGQVQAPVVTVRAPADGVLRRQNIGVVVPVGDALGHVLAATADPAVRRAEAARLATLRADLIRIEVASRAIADARTGFAERASAETAARTRLAEARLGEADAVLDAAEGRRREAEAALTRAASLSATGVGTQADLARIRVAVEVAAQEVETAQRRVLLARHERDAAREGLLPADPAGRMPEAERAVRDLALRSGELASEAAGLRAAISAVEAAILALDRAASRDVVITSAVSGRVLEWLEVDGAPVRIGQRLLRLAVCDAAHVVLPARDGSPPWIQADQPVRVRLAGEGGFREGRVRLSPEGGPVTIAVDRSDGCVLGQPAEIAFGARPFDIFRR